jgi:two-component system response regulator AtoC
MDRVCDHPSRHERGLSSSNIMKAPLIAIVDDDLTFANYLRTFLEGRAYQTRIYGRGEEVVAAVQRGDVPDVVLLDVLMPGMDGLATLRSLKAACREVQVIMLSGREHATTIVEALNLGAVNYVVKPDDSEGLGEIALDAAIKQVVEKNRLVSEVTELRRQVHDDEAQAFLLWEGSDAMRKIAVMIDRVADSDVTVLIRGESGVGKERVARALHDRSLRCSKPFVKVNCAALPDELLESELFGHEKGAFTGASALRIGKFEHAHQGTLMLDEIGEMKPGLQGKLLHVLQDGDFSRLGSNKRVTADVRVIAATNRNLEAMLEHAEFREDLYYRLKVIEIDVPPLRERSDEIPRLFEFFVDKYAKRYNRSAPSLSPALRDAMERHSWPGNIRELENVVKRFIILQDEELLQFDLHASDRGRTAASPAPRAMVRPAGSEETLAEPTVPAVADHAPLLGPPVPISAAIPVSPAGPNGAAGPMGGANESKIAHAGDGAPAVSLAEAARTAMLRAERDLLIPTLHRVHWNRRKAAPLLGVSYKTLLNKIKEHGIIQE